MATPEFVQSLMQDVESDRIERTVSTSHSDKFAQALARSFDAQPCATATLDDLDLDRFLIGYRRRVIAEDVIATNGRSVPQQLAGLRFFDLQRNCPSHAGVLLFGHRPVRFLPGAYVQFLRLAGDEATSEVIDAKEVQGDLMTVLQTLDLLIDAHLRQCPVFVSTLREDIESDYPKAALRELLLNAVMHRDYQSHTPVRFYLELGRRVAVVDQRALSAQHAQAIAVDVAERAHGFGDDGVAVVVALREVTGSLAEQAARVVDLDVTGVPGAGAGGQGELPRAEV